MKILMLHPHDIFSPLEPWTIRIVSFAKEFSKAGHKIKLIYYPLNFSASRKIEQNLNFEVIPLERKLGLINFIKNILFVIKISQWADIIHFQKCFYWASIPALIAGWVNNKPLHYDWDDWETEIFYDCPDSSAWRNFVGGFMRLIENLLPRIVDTVSVSSQALHDLCIKLGKSREDIFKVPVGVDLEKFSPQISGETIKKKFNFNGQIVLYLGQLHSAQYAGLFIYAAKEILESIRDLDVHFLLVGGGFRVSELKRLSENLGLNGRITFTGAVPQEEVPLFIASADVCVACFNDNEISRAKSPLKVVEYMASGKAVVASNVGEVKSMIEGAGILTGPGNVTSLSRGIVNLLRNKVLRENMGNKAREKMEKGYSWSTIKENLLIAYGRAINYG
jgi:glycosyltransferase involved in cell wall biosynthesis